MNNNLAKEILKNASEIPLECQEKILDNMKAMIFTKRIMLKQEKEAKENRRDRVS